MDFDLTSPEDLIEPSWIDTYKEDIEHIWWPIVDLNTNLFVLEKIIQFPFHIFELEYTLFWRMIKVNVYEKCMLIIANLTTDKSKHALTISKLKNNIRRHILNDKYREMLDHELKQMHFNKSIRELSARVTIFRNKKIAHFDREWIRGMSVLKLNVEAPDLNELKMIRDKINELFAVLCFSSKHSPEYSEYSSKIQYPPDTDTRSDIENILDNIAFNSTLLNMPEQQKELWPHYRQDLSEDDISILNEYRKKFKLNPI